NPGLMRTGSPRNADFKGQHRAEYAWFSISDSLPLTSIDATRAARQIVTACRDGVGEITLGLPAKAAVTFHGLFPSLSVQIVGLLNRLLPRPVGIGERKALGKDSTSVWAPSLLTVLGERAAQANNEIK
ncbi:MAG TPA: ketoacyl reductase, partial [Candidatus Competibacteraceae bacterium]|nr:ketoacyl reductase [Candidatus Competibacteraceae bacterium]